MRLRPAPVLLVATLALSLAAQEERFSGKEFRKPFANPVDDPDLPRVLLIGDSISIAYTIPVRRRLQGKANVHRIPVNGAYSEFGVKNVRTWIGSGRWDVIHFNFGLWDWYGWKQETRVTPETYAANLGKIVADLRTTGAALVFATTTPPCAEPEHKIKVRVTEDQARAFNDAAIRVMKANGIAINDLYGCISADRARYSRGPADVHWNQAGSELLGRQVAASILEAIHAKADARRIAELEAYWAEVSRAVREGDAEGYTATCHPKGILVAGTSNRCHPLSDALVRWKREFDATKAGRMKASVEFRFSRRLGDRTTAHETGIFLYSSTDVEGNAKKEYINFEALLLKEPDGWKILMEYQKSKATPEEWDRLK